MRLTSITLAALGAFSVASAIPRPQVLPAPPAPNPTAPYPDISKQPSNTALVEFDLIWWYINLGLPQLDTKTMYGNWTTCYNSPGWTAYLTGSIKPLSNSAGCWVYKETDCEGDFVVVPKGGEGVWEGRSGSFACDTPV